MHRIGRTARAGNSGKAISFASEGTADHLKAIESFISMKIPVQTADIDLFATDRSLESSSRNRYQNFKSNNGRSNFTSKNKHRKKVKSYYGITKVDARNRLAGLEKS